MAYFFTIFFRIANFMVFITFILYMYRTYIKASIAQALHNEQAIVDGLYRERDASLTIHADYKEKVIMQREQYMRLQKKIMQWRQAVDDENMVRAKEKDCIVANLVNRVSYKRDQLFKEALVAQVASGVVDKTHEKLTNFFSDEEKGVSFLHTIITSLKENNT